MNTDESLFYIGCNKTVKDNKESYTGFFRSVPIPSQNFLLSSFFNMNDCSRVLDFIAHSKEVDAIYRKNDLTWTREENEFVCRYTWAKYASFKTLRHWGELFAPEDLIHWDVTEYKNMCWYRFPLFDIMIPFFNVWFNRQNKQKYYCTVCLEEIEEFYFNDCVSKEELDEYRRITGEEVAADSFFCLQHEYPKHWKTSPIIIETTQINNSNEACVCIVNGYRLFKERFGL